jgi:hypothetical protein
VADATFTQVTLGTEAFDIGGHFASSGWTPPAGKMLVIGGLYVNGTITAGDYTIIAIYKNGASFAKGIWFSGAHNDGSGFVSCIDDANGSDVYTLYGFSDVASGTATFKGSSDQTFFMGTMI